MKSGIFPWSGEIITEVEHSPNNFPRWVTTLNEICWQFNANKLVYQPQTDINPKLRSPLIIQKALIQVFKQFPSINSLYECSSQLLLWGSHDFGIVIETPSSLLMLVVQYITSRITLSSSGSRSRALWKLAKDGKSSLLSQWVISAVLAAMCSVQWLCLPSCGLWPREGHNRFPFLRDYT